MQRMKSDGEETFAASFAADVRGAGWAHDVGGGEASGVGRGRGRTRRKEAGASQSARRSLRVIDAASPERPGGSHTIEIGRARDRRW